MRNCTKNDAEKFKRQERCHCLLQREKDKNKFANEIAETPKSGRKHLRFMKNDIILFCIWDVYVWIRYKRFLASMCSHGDNSGGGLCAASVANFDRGSVVLIYNLNTFINKDKVTVLNERIPNTGIKVFKNWGEHTDKTDFVESDVDEELIFNISFTGHVKVTGLTLIGDLDETHPSRLLIFKDRENMSFSEVANAKPTQEMQLKQDDCAQIDYPLIVTNFASVSHLTLYFPFNFGAEQSRIYYIGLRGEFEQNFREKIVIASYETRPVPDDHKAELPEPSMHHIC